MNDIESEIAAWIRGSDELRGAVSVTESPEVLYQVITPLAEATRTTRGRVTPYSLDLDLADRMLAESIDWPRTRRLVDDEPEQEAEPIVLLRAKVYMRVSLGFWANVDVRGPASGLIDDARSLASNECYEELSKIQRQLDLAGFEVEDVDEFQVWAEDGSPLG